MNQSKPNTTDGLNEQTGSAKLVSELQLIFAIYAKDLKVFRETGISKTPDGGSNFQLLHDTEMFDMVVKLLNVSDKIKKLDVVEGDGEENKGQSAPIRNIQAFTLSKGKKA